MAVNFIAEIFPDGLRVGDYPVIGFDKGKSCFSQTPAGNSYHPRIKYSGERKKIFFYFQGIDIFSSPDEHVPPPAGYAVKTIFVFHPQIAGMEPTILVHELRGFLRHVIVSRHHHRSANTTLSIVSGRQISPDIIPVRKLLRLNLENSAWLRRSANMVGTPYKAVQLFSSKSFRTSRAVYLGTVTIGVWVEKHAIRPTQKPKI